MKAASHSRWGVSLLLATAAAFYFGHEIGIKQCFRANAAVSTTHACQTIDLLKAGNTEEALRLQTLLVNMDVGFMSHDMSLSRPTEMFSKLPSMLQTGAMRSAARLHRNHPDVALNATSLAALQTFESEHR